VTEVARGEVIKQSVVAGLGVAVLSSWATALQERTRLLAPVRDKRLRKQRPFYVVRRKDRLTTAAMAALWDCLTTEPPG
jgi:DNA-binding transcriptional LysR family regulator